MRSGSPPVSASRRAASSSKSAAARISLDTGGGPGGGRMAGGARPAAPRRPLRRLRRPPARRARMHPLHRRPVALPPPPPATHEIHSGSPATAATSWRRVRGWRLCAERGGRALRTPPPCCSTCWTVRPLVEGGQAVRHAAMAVTSGDRAGRRARRGCWCLGEGWEWCSERGKVREREYGARWVKGEDMRGGGRAGRAAAAARLAGVPTPHPRVLLLRVAACWSVWHPAGVCSLASRTPICACRPSLPACALTSPPRAAHASPIVASCTPPGLAHTPAPRLRSAHPHSA